MKKINKGTAFLLILFLISFNITSFELKNNKKLIKEINKKNFKINIQLVKKLLKKSVFLSENEYVDIINNKKNNPIILAIIFNNLLSNTKLLKKIKKKIELIDLDNLKSSYTQLMIKCFLDKKTISAPQKIDLIFETWYVVSVSLKLKKEIDSLTKFWFNMIHKDDIYKINDYRDDSFSTVLHCAVIYDLCECVKILLNFRNINVDLLDKYNFTPLHWAAYNGNSEMIKIILKKNPTILNARQGKK